MALRYQLASIGHRDILRSGGTLSFTMFLSVLFSIAARERAELAKGNVPEVDRVSIRIVTDSYHMAVAQDGTVGNVEIKRFGFALGNHPPGRAILSEFGLALLANSQRSDQSRWILMDFGYTPQTLLNNLELLEIDPALIDALVLSHGHYDHFGGLVGFLEQTKSKRKPKLPIYLGGEECFCARQWLAPPMRGDFGALDRTALEANNLSIMFSPEPALIADHAFTTGKIDLTSFEKVLAPSMMKIGRVGNFGCYPEAFSEEERQKGAIPDQFRHEIGTAFNLKGHGLIVLTACSHRGVINIIRQAQKVAGIEKIHAVIGGFHLAPHNEDYIRETIHALAVINPDFVIPLHCSGELFYEMMKAQMPAKLLRGYTGTEFIFRA